MASPSGPQQPFPNDPQQFPPSSGQPGQFPPPSGQPGQPGQFPPPQGGFQPAAPPQPARRGGGWKKRIISIVVGLVVLGGIAAVGAYLNRDAANKAKVGDCVSQEGSDELKVVECSSSEADFKVVGRVEDKTQAEAGISACGPFVDQGAEQAYWEGERGKKGLVLCLGPVG
jgi:hypothetical protein